MQRPNFIHEALLLFEAGADFSTASVRTVDPGIIFVENLMLYSGIYQVLTGAFFGLGKAAGGKKLSVIM